MNTHIACLYISLCSALNCSNLHLSISWQDFSWLSFPLLPLHLVTQLHLFIMSWLIYSMNILIKCCCRDQFLYGVMNLYSWPWMRIWRCVIIEESCPTKEVYRGNYVCYVCISWNEPVWHTQTDTLTQMKNEENRNMQDLCVTRGGFWSSGLKCDASRRDVFQWWLDVEGGGRTKRVEAFWDPKVIIYAPKDFTILWMNYVRAICSRRGMIKVQLEERRRVKNKWDIMIALFIIAG